MMCLLPAFLSLPPPLSRGSARNRLSKAKRCRYWEHQLMSKKRVPSVRPPVRPPPLDARPKNQPLAVPRTQDLRRVPASPATSDRGAIETAKSTKSTTDDAVTTAGDRSKNSPTERASVTDRDIARRAYDLYLTRGCEHGHDVEDWLQAERDLRDAVSSAKPWVM